MGWGPSKGLLSALMTWIGWPHMSAGHMHLLEASLTGSIPHSLTDCREMRDVPPPPPPPPLPTEAHFIRRICWSQMSAEIGRDSCECGCLTLLVHDSRHEETLPN